LGRSVSAACSNPLRPPVSRPARPSRLSDADQRAMGVHCRSAPMINGPV
jgi:hypothetical protein